MSSEKPGGNKEDWREQFRREQEEARKRLAEEKQRAKDDFNRIKEEAKRAQGSRVPRDAPPGEHSGENTNFEKELERDAAHPEENDLTNRILKEARNIVSDWQKDLLFFGPARTHYNISYYTQDVRVLLEKLSQFGKAQQELEMRFFSESKLRIRQIANSRQKELFSQWHRASLDFIAGVFRDVTEKIRQTQDAMGRVLREEEARRQGQRPPPGGGGRSAGERPGPRQAPRPEAPSAESGQSEEEKAIGRVMNEFGLSRTEYDLIINIRQLQGMPDPQFRTLVSRVFGTGDIKESYRELARKLHPDKGKTGRGERFRVITTLYDEYKRRTEK